MTILEENHHSFLIVEHDPMLYEDAKEMVEYVAQALKQTSREATILLYSPALDPHLQKMTELADRVFCIYEASRLRRKASEGRGEDARRPEPRWRHTHEVAMEAGGEADRAQANGKQVLELETAKEILAEIFQPAQRGGGDVEEII